MWCSAVFPNKDLVNIFVGLIPYDYSKREKTERIEGSSKTNLFLTSTFDPVYNYLEHFLFFSFVFVCYILALFVVVTG